MPVLPDAKYEKFAQGLAKGSTQTKAYKDAGFKGDRGHASRLASNGNIKARVKEIQESMAKQVVEEAAWDARTMFERHRRLADLAMAAGDIKTAAQIEQFIIRCFGYEDSPTMTQEAMLGRAQVPAKIDEQVDEEPRKVVRMSDAITAMRKAARRA